MVVIAHGKGDKHGIVKVHVDVLRAICEYLEAVKGKNGAPDAPLFVCIDRAEHATAER